MRALSGLLLAALAGCYHPDPRACAVRCGAGALCPSGQRCGGDGYCHAGDEGAMCVCTPKSCTEVGAFCGAIDDGCGKSITCPGVCRWPQTCGTDPRTPNQCNCIPGRWSLETVDSDGFVGTHSAIAVDAAGGIHIAYRRSLPPSDAYVEYAYRKAGDTAWSFTTVDRDGAPGLHNRIEVDRAGGVHIVYSDDRTDTLKYAYRAGGAGADFTFQTIDRVGSNLRDHDLAIGADDTLHVSYANPSGALSYARKVPGAGFVLEPVRAGQGASAPVDARQSTIAVQGDALHIVAYHTTSQQLVHLVRPSVGASWTTSVVDATGVTGGLSSLAVDPAGVGHVVWLRSLGQQLLYARLPPGGNPQQTAIEAVGADSSGGVLALDPAGVPFVVYERSTPTKTFNDYDLADWSATRAAAGTVDGLGRAGSADLVADPAGGLHVSYYDYDAEDLKYGYRCR